MFRFTVHQASENRSVRSLFFCLIPWMSSEGPVDVLSAWVDSVPTCPILCCANLTQYPCWMGMVSNVYAGVYNDATLLSIKI